MAQLSFRYTDTQPVSPELAIGSLAVGQIASATITGSAGDFYSFRTSVVTVDDPSPSYGNVLIEPAFGFEFRQGLLSNGGNVAISWAVPAELAIAGLRVAFGAFTAHSVPVLSIGTSNLVERTIAP